MKRQEILQTVVMSLFVGVMLLSVVGEVWCQESENKPTFTISGPALALLKQTTATNAPSSPSEQTPSSRPPG